MFLADASDFACFDPMEHQVAATVQLSDDELLRRAVANARPHSSRGWRTRRLAVMECLGLGAQSAEAMCFRFALDPDEIVKR